MSTAATTSSKCLEDVVTAAESDRRLDGPVALLQRIGGALDRSAAGPLLRGDWLGHPVHPMLTDLPIGCWTSSMILDVVGGDRSRTASRRLIGWGVAAAAPTVAAGMVDLVQLGDRRKHRVGVVHAASNAVGTALYVLSWRARRRGQHGRGVMLGLVAGAVATVGGYLGGHLAFGPSVGSHDGDGSKDGLPDRNS